ncbi:hypothetical protein ACFQX7_28695 [Luedemannella flava]
MGAPVGSISGMAQESLRDAPPSGEPLVGEVVGPPGPPGRADLPPWLARLFARERPVPPTPASRWLRALLLVTAATVVIVEVVNLRYTRELGFSLLVRSFWALLRVIGFLVLMRAVRYGRLASRPFGLILAVTTVFAVARLAEPRTGDFLPPVPVLVSFFVLAAECAFVVWLLYRSDAVHQHLTGRPVRRHIPAWVLTVRVAAVTYAALLSVPLIVAVGEAFTSHRRQSAPVTLGLLIAWFLLTAVCGYVAAVASYFVLRGHRWARWVVGFISVVVLVAQPFFCFALLGVDGLIRDGVPLIVTAGLGLVALARSRGQATWYDPNVTD